MSAPATSRLQQLVQKAESGQPLSPADELLDRQAGFYAELIQVKEPVEARTLVIRTNTWMREEGLSLRENFVMPVLAASLELSQKYADALKVPDKDAPDVLEKISAVLGVRPEIFKGAQLSMLAEIMERDLDLPAFEKQVKRFGFTVADGAIAAWTPPAPEAPVAPSPPPRLG